VACDRVSLWQSEKRMKNLTAICGRAHGAGDRGLYLA
jgi:hypothetical protein